jgi:hypothetical protein
VPRFRFFDTDDPNTPVDWRIPAAILPTLFLGARFWFAQGIDSWTSSAPLAIAVFGVAAILCAALFFIGPALAAQAAGSFPSMLASAFGIVPGFGVQLVCVIYLVIWTAQLMATVCYWLGPTYRPLPPIEFGLLVAVILLFVSLTSCQNIRTTATMARLPIRLGAAVLIASLIRVRAGWFAIPMGLFSLDQRPHVIHDLWQGISDLSYFVAPLALLAAVFVTRLPNQKSVATTALMGLVAPLAGSLVTTTAIDIAAGASRFYSRGLPSVGAVLIVDVTRSHQHAVLQILALTMLGSLRFGVAALRKAAPVQWIFFGALIGTIVWYATQPPTNGMEGMLELSTNFLAAASAILTVGALTRSGVREPKMFDVAATLSLACGLGTPAFARFWWPEIDDSWGHPWLLPTYAIAFVAHLLLSKRGARRLLSLSS